VFLFRGLLSAVDGDDELAFVIGHEIGHTAGRHAVQRLEGSMVMGFFIRMFFGQNSSHEAGANLITLLLEPGYSRQQELEADRRAVFYMARAGFRPESSLDVMARFERLREERTGVLESPCSDPSAVEGAV